MSSGPWSSASAPDRPRSTRSLPLPFILTARAENLLHGRLDLDDTIRRLQAVEKAGAEVLYAPGLRDLATIRVVVSSVTRPVNVVASFMDPSITLAQLSEVGVKRISVGGSLSPARPWARRSRSGAIPSAVASWWSPTSWWPRPCAVHDARGG